MDSSDVIALQNQIKSEFPSFKIVAKNTSYLMKLIDRFLKVITFGKMSTFMTAFVTTIGSTVYVPTAWHFWAYYEQATILRHERVHMRQSRRLTMPLYRFLYLVPIFPLGLALGRAKLEMEAYAETLRAYHEYGCDIKSPHLRDSIVGNFILASYGWMWPFNEYMQSWYDKTVAQILTE